MCQWKKFENRSVGEDMDKNKVVHFLWTILYWGKVSIFLYACMPHSKSEEVCIAPENTSLKVTSMSIRHPSFGRQWEVLLDLQLCMGSQLCFCAANENTLKLQYKCFVVFQKNSHHTWHFRLIAELDIRNIMLTKQSAGLKVKIKFKPP